MLTSQVFKSRTGLHYSLRLSNKGAQLNSLKPKTFIDKNTASQFVHNLQVPLFFWENLARSNSFFSYSNWNNTNPWSSIEDYIAQALMQGSVQAYSSSASSELQQSIEKRRFKKSGLTFEFLPASCLLTDTPKEQKMFSSLAETQGFLNTLYPAREQLTDLVQSLNLSDPPASTTDAGLMNEALGKALLKGEIVITQEAEARKPEAQDIIEEVAEVVRSNTQEPAPAPAATESDEDEVEDKVCEFSDFRLHCQHKVDKTRKFELDVINKEPNHNESQYGLQVIAPPGTPDYISVLFDGVCNQGSETCGGIKVSGPNTSKLETSGRYSFKVSPKKLKNDEGSSFTNFLTTNLIPSLTNGLQYETYTVESQSCASNNSHKAIIQAFPSFKWAGEISIGYKQNDDKPKETQWITKGKIGGNIGERTLSYDTETKNDAKEYFPGLQGTLGDTLSQLDKFSSSKGALGSLVKFDIESAISLGGTLELKESNKNYNVGLGGDISINLNPLFGATVSVDIFDYLALQAGGPILLKYKEMASKGEKHAVVIKAVVSVKGTITANLKWEKGADDKWLSTKGTQSSQAALGVTIGLNAEISVKSKIIFTEICVAVGAKASLQGARNNAEGIGIVTTLIATTAEDKPAVAGSIAFTGATLYYSYYAEIGVSEAESKTDEEEPLGRGGDNAGNTTAAETTDSKVTPGKESKIPIFEYREWPNSNSNSEPITVDQVTF